MKRMPDEARGGMKRHGGRGKSGRAPEKGEAKGRKIERMRKIGGRFTKWLIRREERKRIPMRCSDTNDDPATDPLYGVSRNYLF